MSRGDFQGPAAGPLPSVSGVYEDANARPLVEVGMVVEVYGSLGLAHFFNDPPQLAISVQVLMSVAQLLQHGPGKRDGRSAYRPM